MERIFRQLLLTIALAAISSVGFAQSSASIINVPLPAYPMKEKREGHEGIVRIAVTISNDGSVASARISGSSGFPKLDQSALDAAKTGKYFPAKDASGQTVESEVIVAISFDSGVESTEKQRTYLIKMLGMGCSEYQEQLLKVSASEQKKPSESYNFRFPLILFEELMQSERKPGKNVSLIADSEAIFQRYESHCARHSKISAYEAFSKAVNYKQ